MPFAQALDDLMQRCPSVRGAAFTDLDGEEIALEPSSARETLRLCAAYGGIALRRLSTAESAAGRGPIHQVALRGSTGAFVTLKVGEEYQLVLHLDDRAPQGQVLLCARDTVTTLEANI
ncbi:MAG: hypothetical protein H6704_19625 [Myxococcales bacterium]|nr:hypothetical protein [Myxococcales bacterium]